jgi:hypothetical protein
MFKRNPITNMSYAWNERFPKSSSSNLFVNGIYHIDTYVRPVSSSQKEVTDINAAIENEQVISIEVI